MATTDRQPAMSATGPATSGRWTRWLGVLAFLTVLAALFSLTGRYQGIRKDGLIYVLQGLARLSPDPLSGDVFLRFGSQDQFSVISVLSSNAIELFGIDHGAALLTFGFLSLWYLSAWGLSRRIAGDALALLSVGLLLFLPGWYGAKQLFRYAEPMMTARSLAEGLSLAALWALAASRHKTAVAMLVLGVAVHPLMAFPAALLALLYWSPAKGAWSWTGLGVALTVIAVAGALVLGQPSPLMAEGWLSIVRFRSNFLFTETWESHDWEIPAQVFSTLALGVLAVEPGAGRRLLQCALVVGIVGLTLAIVSSEWLPLRLLLQGQPWRWEWIGRVLATALLPWILAHVWKSNERVAGAVVSVMAVGWILGGSGSFQSLPPFGAGGLLCVGALALWLLRNRLTGVGSRYMNGMSVGVIFIACLSAVMTAVAIHANDASFGMEPVFVQRLQDALSIPLVSVPVVFMAWYLVVARTDALSSMVVLGLAVSLLAAAGPGFYKKWSKRQFGPEQRAEFAEWRDLIPKEAEVLWPEAPQMAWYLLDRRSYMSISQGAGLVFSEQTAEELMRRALALEPLVTPGKWFLDPATNEIEFNRLNEERLSAICKAPGLSFVISRDALPNAVRRAEWPGKADYIYLYDCSKISYGA